MKKWMIALMMAALLIVPMGGIAYAVGEGAPAAPVAGGETACCLCIWKWRRLWNPVLPSPLRNRTFYKSWP